jgi:hypothetical protein
MLLVFKLALSDSLAMGKVGDAIKFRAVAYQLSMFVPVCRGHCCL